MSPTLLLFYCSSGCRFVFIIIIILPTYVDTESNSAVGGRDYRYNFLLCYWSLNSMTTHSFEKISLLEGWNLINQVDVISLLESYLNSSTASDKDKLKINIRNYIELTTLIMSKETMYVCIRGNHHLLGASVIHQWHI